MRSKNEDRFRELYRHGRQLRAVEKQERKQLCNDAQNRKISLRGKKHSFAVFFYRQYCSVSWFVGRFYYYDTIFEWVALSQLFPIVGSTGGDTFGRFDQPYQSSSASQADSQSGENALR